MNTKQKKKGKKRIVIWSMIFAAVIALISIVAFWPRGNNDFQEEKAQTGDIITYYSFSGVVEAKSRQNLSSQKEMHIDKIFVKEGDQVKKGDVLLKNGVGEQIKAEIDGEISRVYVKNNTHVLPGTQLIDIVDFDALQTNVKVDEYDLKNLKIGNKVDVTIQALGKEMKGTISRISKEATNENGVSYFTATIDLKNDKTIRVGMSAEAKILKEKAIGVTTLSMDAIRFDTKNKPYVLLPTEKGIPIKKYIHTGMNDGTTVEIKDGIGAGDVVIISAKEQGNSDAAMMHGGNQ
ncbi:efflux RND transporter periplasmic adaptor subunit [Bacillus xiapuensis]|uniref:HlyD family efflux transporter periplasmic adaptor subunit n=1 Tax=Bacillus xiapuensis TaxID=2014075 RepID=A0ABU6NCK4_9BACI|nr:HlyD family efflux transporter periplasmic adaptor subunit [Bacillus xiapuensis]